MNRTLVFASVGAVATALLVAMLIGGGSGKKSDTPKKEILVATKDIALGSELTASNARWQKWPDDATVPGALYRNLVKDEDWKQQKIRRALTKGEPVTEGALVREVKGSYLAAALEPGMRAVSIDVKAASGVAGFLSPNDRVDVILVYTVRMNGADSTKLQEFIMERASETIIEDARILATDQDAAGNTGTDRKAKVNKTVTLEVTPEGAEKLALGAQLGDIHLSLRQLGDKTLANQKTKPVVTDVSMNKIMQHAIKLNNENSFEKPIGQIRFYGNNDAHTVPIVNAPGKASGEAK